MPTIFREIWTRNEIIPDPSITAWVMNPGQNFIIDDAILEEYPSLKVLVTPSTGSNHIDRKACGRRALPVYSLLDDREGLSRIAASAEFTFALLLNVMRRPDLGSEEVLERRWRSREHVVRGHELSGRLVGLIGFGRIGRRMARYCQAFDAQVVYHDPYVAEVALPAWRLEAIFERCDAVCLCCSLTEETRGMINGNLLARLKPDAALVNTSRGEVIVEEDLVTVLEQRADLRVGLDVLSGETSNLHHASPLLPWHDRGRIVITPHMAGATVESQRKAAVVALNLLRRHLKTNRAWNTEQRGDRLRSEPPSPGLDEQGGNRIV